MTNHYSVLGIPNYSPWAVVRKAYIKEIKKYHPDVNSSQEAILICQRLNVAKEALETDSKKSAYDRRLRYSISNPNSTQTYRPAYRPKYRKSRETIRKERSQRNMARNKVRWMKEYESWIKVFPFKFRMAVLGILSLVFLFLLFQVLFSTIMGLWLTASMFIVYIYHSLVSWMSNLYYENNYYLFQKGMIKTKPNLTSKKLYKQLFWSGLGVVVFLKGLVIIIARL